MRSDRLFVMVVECEHFSIIFFNVFTENPAMEVRLVEVAECFNPNKL